MGLVGLLRRLYTNCLAKCQTQTVLKNVNCYFYYLYSVRMSCEIKFYFFTTLVKSWSDYFISLKYCFLMNKSPYKNEGRDINLYILIPNLTVQKYILGGPRMGSIPMCGRKIESSPEKWSCCKLHRYHHLLCSASLPATQESSRKQTLTSEPILPTYSPRHLKTLKKVRHFHI